jgi:hypothetical protein
MSKTRVMRTSLPVSAQMDLIHAFSDSRLTVLPHALQWYLFFMRQDCKDARESQNGKTNPPHPVKNAADKE